MPTPPEQQIAELDETRQRQMARLVLCGWRFEPTEQGGWNLRQPTGDLSMWGNTTLENQIQRAWWRQSDPSGMWDNVRTHPAIAEERA